MAPPSRILEALDEQHLLLRKQMVCCEILADDVDAGECPPAALWEAVDGLRQALDAHNRFEERALRRLLGAIDPRVDPFVDARIETMFVEHVHAHRALNEQITTETSTAALRAALEAVRGHLEAEERELVNPRVLRDEAVIVNAAH